MALGIGANTAIFSVIDTVLLRPAPVRDIDSLAVVWETDRNTSTTREPASLPDFLDFQQRSQRVEQLAAFMGSEVNYIARAGRGDPPAGARSDARAAADARRADRSPAAGSPPEETRPGGPAVVVISEGFWTRAFGRDPAIVGRTIRLDDAPFTVSWRSCRPRRRLRRLPDPVGGGLLAGIRRPRRARRGGPLAAVSAHDADRCRARRIRSSWSAGCAGSAASTQEELAAIAADLERAYPENPARGVFVEPLSTVVFGPVRPALLVLLARRRPGPARRMRECRQPAARTRNGAAARSRRPHRARRQRRTAGASVRGRRPAARASLAAVARRRAGDRSACARWSRSRRPTSRALPTPSVDLRVLDDHARRRRRRRTDVRDGPGAAGAAGRPAGRAEGRRRPRRVGRRRAHTAARSILVIAECALAVMLVIGATLLIKSFWRHPARRCRLPSRREC